MVAFPETTSRIERYFSDVEVELGFLPELAQDWEGDENLAERLDWGYEWAELMVQYDTLFDSYRADLLDAPQRTRFVALTQRMREALPLLKQLELPTPLRPLDVVPLPQE